MVLKVITYINYRNMSDLKIIDIKIYIIAKFDTGEINLTSTFIADININS